MRGRRAGVGETRPFWETKRLAEMTATEWESLCDGCGKCCLVKLHDVDRDVYEFTDVACRLLDGRTCRCRDYRNRQRLVKDCVRLTTRNVTRLGWLPATCAYKLVADGEPLYWWHPLVSGDPETVHLAGISVRGRVVSETLVDEDDVVDHIVPWPSEKPPRTG